MLGRAKRKGGGEVIDGKYIVVDGKETDNQPQGKMINPGRLYSGLRQTERTICSQGKHMKVERAVDSKVKESLRPTTPTQSGINIRLVFMPADRVLRMIVRTDKFTCVDS